MQVPSLIQTLLLAIKRLAMPLQPQPQPQPQSQSPKPGRSKPRMGVQIISIGLGILSLLLASIAQAQTPLQGPAVPPAARLLTVYAASSLKEALDACLTQFNQSTGILVQPVYGSSAQLARQIAAGAPADLFLSADTDWMQQLIKQDLIRPEMQAPLLGNQLVLIAPVNAAATPASALTIAPGFALKAALGDERLAIAEPNTVPAGRYAKAALQTLGVWSQVQDRLAPAESVRAALAYVASGQLPLGIVYATDAQAEPRVRVVGMFPESTHPPIVYPAGVLKSAENSLGARQLWRFLRSNDARQIWLAHGFSVSFSAQPSF